MSWHGGFVDGRELGEPPMVEVSIRQGGGGLQPKLLGGGAADVLAEIGASEGEAQSVGVFAGQCTFKVIAVIGDHNCVTGQFVIFIHLLHGTTEIKPIRCVGLRLSVAGWDEEVICADGGSRCVM